METKLLAKDMFLAYATFRLVSLTEEKCDKMAAKS